MRMPTIVNWRFDVDEKVRAALQAVWSEVAKYFNALSSATISGGVNDITSGCTANCSITPGGTDQGIYAFQTINALAVTVQTSFIITSNIDFIDITMPFPLSVFLEDSPVFIGSAMAYSPAGTLAMKPGGLYQGVATERNHLQLYTNDFTQWPANPSSVYVVGQITIPLL